MEPGFQRDDILFLENVTREVFIGDVVVYKVPGKDIPIVHRASSVFKTYVPACLLACPPCRGVSAVDTSSWSSSSSCM
jgi:hypothetical protein